MDPTFAAWAALIAGLVGLLVIDLFVLHRGAHAIPAPSTSPTTNSSSMLREIARFSGASPDVERPPGSVRTSTG